MRIVKVRRVGNSNVVSIPREYESKGYAPGSSVLLDELPDGGLRLLPIFVSGAVSCLSSFIRKAGNTFHASAIGLETGANMTPPCAVAEA